MKKIIFTIIIALISSLQAMSGINCQVPTCTCLFFDPPVTLSGILQSVPLPCELSSGGEPCLPCMTVALKTDEQLYYLNVWDDNLNALLDTLIYPVKATITGHVYGPAISVLDISILPSLPSLCDTWNMLETFTCGGPYCRLQTHIFSLTTDTLIQDTYYVKLIKQEDADTYYKGALREGTNKDIYFIPSGSTHEYLLYNFNAQVGDRLSNLWFGGLAEWWPNGLSATITEISNSSPRVFSLEAEVAVYAENNDTALVPIYWIEGVGMASGPAGLDYFYCIASHGQVILCAYKNGEQVYVSGSGEQYGCEYNYDPFNAIPSIPSQDVQCSKELRNGQLLIIRGDKTYTVTGQEVK